mmetsp:Transcript_25068/g.63067  ORF Transcript_25068/g.63067 Transcript_25068/m.63067 type:complete len:297 (-) Transcript_25068:133-1023(-)
METRMVTAEHPAAPVVENNATSEASAIARLRLSGEDAANFIRISAPDAAQKAAFLLALSHERNGYPATEFSKALSSLAPKEVHNQDNATTMSEAMKEWEEKRAEKGRIRVHFNWTKGYRRLANAFYLVIAIIMVTLLPVYQLDAWGPRTLRPRTSYYFHHFDPYKNASIYYSVGDCVYFRYPPFMAATVTGSVVGLVGMTIAVLAQYKRQNDKLWLSTCGLSALAACCFIIGSAYAMVTHCGNTLFPIQLGFNIASMIGMIINSTNRFAQIKMEKSRVKTEPEPEVVTAEGTRSEV